MGLTTLTSSQNVVEATLSPYCSHSASLASSWCPNPQKTTLTHLTDPLFSPSEFLLTLRGKLFPGLLTLKGDYLDSQGVSRTWNPPRLHKCVHLSLWDMAR